MGYGKSIKSVFVRIFVLEEIAYHATQRHKILIISFVVNSVSWL